MALLLPLVTVNPYSEWCVQRLKLKLELERENPTPHNLEIFQNPAIYYACLAVKRLGELGPTQQQRLAMKSYKPFASRAMMRWLSEDAFVERLPWWLLHDMMGKSSLSDDKLEYFHDGAKIWARHNEIMRIIRRDMVIFFNNIPQQGPRTAEQAGNIMNDLNNKLYHDSLAEEKAANKSEVGVSGGNPPGEGSTAAAAATGGTIGEGQGAAGAAKPGEGVVGSAGASPNEPPAAAPAEDDASPPDDAMEAPGEYLHPNLLTFALFGMFSEHPDPDLDVSVASEEVRNACGEGSDTLAAEKAVGSSGDLLADVDDDDLLYRLVPVRPSKRRRQLRKKEEKRRKLLEQAERC